MILSSPKQTRGFTIQFEKSVLDVDESEYASFFIIYTLTSVLPPFSSDMSCGWFRAQAPLVKSGMSIGVDLFAT
ncbi:hypothetical protein, partial [Petrimonas sulfuriphila]|uniref:hypothetical protein n=1 Tax=Petrimonas sulfuriphila TaxID=285070 RepID=UPI003EB6DC8A